MEIDLELPSGQEDKLDTSSDTNIGDIDGLRAGEEEINSPITNSSFKGNLRLNVGENISARGAAVEEDTPGLDTFGKEVKSYEPQIGLEFETKEAAYSFYREYARSVGFGITIKASRRSKKSGKFIDVKIACCRFGRKSESGTIVNSRSCPKTDCKASMHMKRRQDEKWYIYSFIKEHNHEICPDDFYYALRGRGKQSGITACQKKGMQVALNEVDIHALFEFFMLMQDENPNFFYAIDLDHEKRMRNVFWVDSKNRHDYSNFSDVVFFDSTYFRNKYRVPFVPIVGVNNHFQLMLLGCALIGEETTSTFVWLMRTWLRSVGGQTPKLVITDEGRSLEEAITEVFPDTHHCLCLWNVLRKIPENLVHIVNRSESFMTKFNKCIFRSWTKEEFEKKWWKIVDKFELREDEWLQSLYVNREKWVPTYMSDTFLAGMCSTERSKCISSLFDKYLHKDTSCKEFLDQYKVFLLDRYEEEAKADFQAHHDLLVLKSPSPFEKQMSTLYTHTIFKEFQAEVLGIVSCTLQKKCEDEAIVTYQVDDFEEQQNFIVAWNEADLCICCLCHSFEYKGFLCRHAMIVLQMCGVSNIPSHYILQRWTKTAKIRQSDSEISSRRRYRVQRFNDLFKRAIKLGEEGSLSQENFNIVIYALHEAMEQCVGVNASVKCVLEPITPANQGFLSTEEENQTNNFAKASKKKKIHKNRKVQCETEERTSAVQDTNLQMLNSGAHSRDNSFVPPQDMLGMEGGSRRPTVDCYFGAEQSLQGMGQLNSLSSIPDGYYGNQQGMQGLGQLNSMPLHVSHYGPRQSLQGLLQGQLGFRAPAMHGCFNIQDSLQDMEQSGGGSRKLHNNVSKRLHDKHLLR
ncbi:protein FAR1-RELATED SEQUENCE 2-like isoform X3 [Actinidia eriantha]|uniref:protein FAR1-RELATED SEQUENCE 2-like isoform X3 n=1 Tax=Actinidia eriantha TaxID=165200 RepID=UPI00258BD9D4|nr:protein FAR1-RELATED SEQUENCE 2-like isoform X3 [Actinidia eriantha]